MKLLNFSYCFEKNSHCFELEIDDREIAFCLDGANQHDINIKTTYDERAPFEIEVLIMAKEQQEDLANIRAEKLKAIFQKIVAGKLIFDKYNPSDGSSDDSDAGDEFSFGYNASDELSLGFDNGNEDFSTIKSHLADELSLRDSHNTSDKLTSDNGYDSDDESSSDKTSLKDADNDTNHKSSSKNARNIYLISNYNFNGNNNTKFSYQFFGKKALTEKQQHKVQNKVETYILSLNLETNKEFIDPLAQLTQDLKDGLLPEAVQNHQQSLINGLNDLQKDAVNNLADTNTTETVLPIVVEALNITLSDVPPEQKLPEFEKVKVKANALITKPSNPLWLIIIILKIIGVVFAGVVGLIVGAVIFTAIGIVVGTWSGPGAAITAFVGLFTGSITGAALGVVIAISLWGTAAAIIAGVGFFKSKPEQKEPAQKILKSCEKSIKEQIAVENGEIEPSVLKNAEKSPTQEPREPSEQESPRDIAIVNNITESFKSKAEQQNSTQAPIEAANQELKKELAIAAPASIRLFGKKDIQKNHEEHEEKVFEANEDDIKQDLATGTTTQAVTYS